MELMQSRGGLEPGPTGKVECDQEWLVYGIRVTKALGARAKVFVSE